MLVAVFIDGGYLIEVLRGFNSPRLDYHQFAVWACQTDELFRTYYYDCLPYQSGHPTPDERQRVADKQRFFTALRRTERFMVREGRLEYRGLDAGGRPIFAQKRADLLLGLDIATLVSRNRVGMVVLVAGDSDLIPAVELARREGVIVRLVHGPSRTFHTELWEAVDERIEMTARDLQQLKL